MLSVSPEKAGQWSENKNTAADQSKLAAVVFYSASVLTSE